MIRNMNINFKEMMLDDFMKLELEDVNYSGAVYCWLLPEVDDKVKAKIFEWELGKRHRIDDVMDQRCFYVENCDIQTPDRFECLLDELCWGGIKDVFFIRTEVDKVGDNE